VGIRKAERLESLKEPGRAGLLTEGRRRDPQQFHLPLAELELMQVQPVEGAVHRGRGGETRDAKLSGSSHFGV
jgi:hypothetical protein